MTRSCVTCDRDALPTSRQPSPRPPPKPHFCRFPCSLKPKTSQIAILQADLNKDGFLDKSEPLACGRQHSGRNCRHPSHPFSLAPPRVLLAASCHPP